MHFHQARVPWRVPFLLARCRLLGTNCFSSADQGLWFIINLCLLGGEDTILWPACVSSTPCPISHMWEGKFHPPFFGKSLLARGLLFESHALIPKLTFLCQFPPLLLDSCVQGGTLSHMLWRLRCKSTDGWWGKGWPHLPSRTYERRKPSSFTEVETRAQSHWWLPSGHFRAPWFSFSALRFSEGPVSTRF